jgi:hypothetical protein
MALFRGGIQGGAAKDSMRFLRVSVGEPTSPAFVPLGQQQQKTTDCEVRNQEDRCEEGSGVAHLGAITQLPRGRRGDKTPPIGIIYVAIRHSLALCRSLGRRAGKISSGSSAATPAAHVGRGEEDRDQYLARYREVLHAFRSTMGTRLSARAWGVARTVNFTQISSTDLPFQSE